MSDARWIEVEDDLDSACRHFENATKIYEEGGFDSPGLPGYKTRMALLHAMQSAYTSLEAALRRILAILGEEPPAGEQAPADLVKRVAKIITVPGHEGPAILPPDVARDVDQTRRFRHRATHDYDNFDPGLAVPSLEAAGRLVKSLKPTIATFKQIIDPPSDRNA